MINLINLCTIVMTSLLLMYTVKRIYRNQFSILHIIAVTFFIIQVLPLLIVPFFDWGAVHRITPYMYEAMCDEYTSIIYDLFVIVSMVLLVSIGDRYSYMAYRTNRDIRAYILSGKFRKVLYMITSLTMFAPLIAILFAPEKEVYLQYAYFTKNTVLYTSEIYLYHTSVMHLCEYLALVSIVANYLFKNKNKSNIYIIIAIFLTTWVDGKRTVFTFCLLAIIAIDFLLETNNIKRVRNKAVLFAILIVAYFIIYSLLTGKNTNENAFNVYLNYFSRLGHVKLAIFSRIYDSKIVDYEGQSLLYNLTFFIPRAFWSNKPYGFYKYFTSYAFYGTTNKDVGINLQVNMFSEFIANLGLLGYLILFIFILFIVKKSERSANFLLYSVGMIFLVFYTLFGFEGTTMIIFILWEMLMIKERFGVTKKRNATV